MEVIVQTPQVNCELLRFYENTPEDTLDNNIIEYFKHLNKQMRFSLSSKLDHSSELPYLRTEHTKNPTLSGGTYLYSVCKRVPAPPPSSPRVGYPVDSDLSSGQCYPPFEQLGPGENDLLLEGPPVTNVVAASRHWVDVRLDCQPLFWEMSQGSLPKSLPSLLGEDTRIRLSGGNRA